jgi:hypothetical protein
MELRAGWLQGRARKPQGSFKKPALESFLSRSKSRINRHEFETGNKSWENISEHVGTNHNNHLSRKRRITIRQEEQGARQAMYAANSMKGYCSQYGWNLALPCGWRVLPKDPSEVAHGLENIEVFAHVQDPSLSMTWMRTGRPIGLRLWQCFCAATIQMGPVPPEEAQELMAYIFRLIGQADRALVISLPDGLRALEVTEEIKSFSGVDESMQGYHLVLPVRGSASGNASPHMQQLSFYARSGKFAREIAGVMKSARSFQYS